MIFLPSRGRRASLQRFFDESNVTLPGRVLIDNDDLDTYIDMQLPDGWAFLSGERCGNVERYNRAFSIFPNEETYGMFADDVVCGPRGWDELLSDAAKPCFVAWGDDGRWENRLFTAGFIGGELVREMGWLAAPVFGHLYADKVWWDIAQGARLASYQPRVQWRHINVSDDTYKQRKKQGDKETYKRILDNGTLKNWIDKAIQFRHNLRVAA